MVKTLKRIASTLIIFIVILSIITFNTNVEIVLALENPRSELIDKISKDYTKKFCNAIAFGLSKESAMAFSLEENKKIFERRKGIDTLNKDILAEKIAVSVINSCGYPINLSGDKDIEEFKNSYLAKYMESLNKK